MSYMEVDDKIQHAMQNTEVLRSPQQTLATFGSTNIYYYIITELVVNTNIVREGRVIAAKPKIVTPVYLTNLEGFSQQARRYVEIMAQKYPHELGIFYSYKNEPKEMNIVSESFNEVLDKINHRIDNQGNPLSAIIKGVEELWDVSLLKFTYELTNNSVHSNVTEMERNGLLSLDSSGVPKDARSRIEELFEKAMRDLSYKSELASELRRWNLFYEYQDRFFNLFKRS
jgi:hypothetical protein